MLCSLSSNDSLILTERDFNFALRLLNENEQYMQDIVDKMGQTQTGKDQNQVLNIITKSGMITHSKLMQRVSYKYDKDMLRLILETLREGGQIECGLTPDRKGQVYYAKGFDPKSFTG